MGVSNRNLCAAELSVKNRQLVKASYKLQFRTHCIQKVSHYPGISPRLPLSPRSSISYLEIEFSFDSISWRRYTWLSCADPGPAGCAIHGVFGPTCFAGAIRFETNQTAKATQDSPKILNEVPTAMAIFLPVLSCLADGVCVDEAGNDPAEDDVEDRFVGDVEVVENGVVAD
jgi:hypothetical protein